MASEQVFNAEQTALVVVIDRLRRHKRIFVGIWAVVVLLAVLYAVFARPVYRAELVLAPAQQEGGAGLGSAMGGQLGQLASFAGISVGQDNNLQTSLAILESKEFTLLFIRNNNLIPVLYEENWDLTADSWHPGEEKSDWQVLEDFGRKVRSVNYDPGSGLVRLRIDWYSGEQASQWANSMGRALNEMVRTRAIEEASESITYLQEELAKNNLIGIDVAINSLIEAQINKIMLANVRKDFAFQVIDPAMPPSGDSQLRPNRPLVLAIGLVFGFFLGGLAAFLVGYRE